MEAQDNHHQLLQQTMDNCYDSIQATMDTLKSQVSSLCTKSTSLQLPHNLGISLLITTASLWNVVFPYGLSTYSTSSSAPQFYHHHDSSCSLPSCFFCILTTLPYLPFLSCHYTLIPAYDQTPYIPKTLTYLLLLYEVLLQTNIYTWLISILRAPQQV